MFKLLSRKLQVTPEQLPSNSPLEQLSGNALQCSASRNALQYSTMLCNLPQYSGLLSRRVPKDCYSHNIKCTEYSGTGMGQFSIYKLKWDLLRASITACTIDKKHFLPHLESFMLERKFEKKFFKKNNIQTPNGVLLIFKLPFPNGSYRNGVCRAL